MIGAGATGRTHLLRSWVAEAGLESSTTAASPQGAAIWLTGSPLRLVSGADVAAARAEQPAMLVADDLQWFDGDALLQLVDAAGGPGGAGPAVVASRRPADGAEPAPDALDLLTEVLTRDEPAHRVGLLDLDAFAPAVAALRAARAARTGGSTGALNTAELAALHAATAGSIGLAADLIATGWTADATAPGPETVEAVVSRVRRAGRAAAELVRLWALIDPDDAEGTPDAELALALRALSQPLRSEGPPTVPGPLLIETAERAARAGGLLAGDGSLIAVVRAALAADLTGAQRGAGHDRLAAVLAGTDPAAAARHLLVGDGQIPDAARLLAGAALSAAGGEPELFADLVARAERLGLPAAEAAVLRALGAFHLGSADALAHLERAESAQDASGGEEELDDRTVALGYGLDLRDLRLASAAARPLAGPLAEPLRSVALVLAGRPPLAAGVDAATTVRSAPLGRVLGTVAGAVDDLARGDQRSALAGLVQAADDFDRLHPTAPLGFTPHGVGALAALLTGDLVAVEHLCSQAVAHGSGGPGEDLFHHLVRAYGRLVRGDYRSALELGRRHRKPGLVADASVIGFGEGDTGADTAIGTIDYAGPTVDALALPQRDRLVLAALEAAIARRSGDTARLRASWQAAEQALLRPSTTWLLLDVFTELLAAGARLGDRRRVEPVLAELTDQALALPPSGPGPTAGWWLRLQVAVAGEDDEAVAEAAAALAGLTPGDERSQARIQAGAVWAGIVTGKALEADVVAASERMSAVGDGWEASRLLGQAALDEDDPRVARRLLEMARVSATEPVETSGDDALVALGLSDREAEVALMVVEGRTHKEIGAQLFISPKTVEHHVAKIRQKLGATSRAELVASIRAAAGDS